MGQAQSKMLIHWTIDHTRFVLKDNRPVDLRHRRDLHQSMEEYGFLWNYPLMCRRLDNGKLLILDGQHRQAVAQKLGLGVAYTLVEHDVNVAALNTTQRPWKTQDYLDRYAAAGNPHYIELKEFCDQHGLSVSNGLSMLCGVSSPHHLMPTFRSGEFVVRNREFADRVARLFKVLQGLWVDGRPINSSYFVMALIQACYIPDFDDERLIRVARRRPDMMRHYGTTDGFLHMLEEMYNFGRPAESHVSLTIEVRKQVNARKGRALSRSRSDARARG